MSIKIASGTVLSRPRRGWHLAAAWLALHALLLPLLLVPIAHTVRGCTTSGGPILQGLADSGSGSRTAHHPDSGEASFAHCPLCLTLQQTAALPPPNAPTFAVAPAALVILYGTAPSEASRWLNLSARARAPPPAV